MKNSLFLPIMTGVLAAGAIAWFLISDDTADIRDEITDRLSNRWAGMKYETLTKAVAIIQSGADLI